MIEQSTDLGVLFGTDPHKLTDQDIDVIIASMRDARVKYIAGEKSAGAPKKMKKEKPKGAIDVTKLEL